MCLYRIKRTSHYYNIKAQSYDQKTSKYYEGSQKCWRGSHVVTGKCMATNDVNTSVNLSGFHVIANAGQGYLISCFDAAAKTNTILKPLKAFSVALIDQTTVNCKAKIIA